MSDPEVKLAKIEVQLENLTQMLKEHAGQDASMFGALVERLDSIDEKLEALLIREAHREGEREGIKRTSVALSACVSSLIGLATVVVQYLAR